MELTDMAVRPTEASLTNTFVGIDLVNTGAIETWIGGALIDFCNRIKMFSVHFVTSCTTIHLTNISPPL